MNLFLKIPHSNGQSTFQIICVLYKITFLSEQFVTHRAEELFVLGRPWSLVPRHHTRPATVQGPVQVAPWTWKGWQPHVLPVCGRSDTHRSTDGWSTGTARCSVRSQNRQVLGTCLTGVRLVFRIGVRALWHLLARRGHLLDVARGCGELGDASPKVQGVLL